MRIRYNPAMNPVGRSALAALLLMTSMTGIPAYATQKPLDVPTATVKFGDLDLGKSSDVKRLYRRLNGAAEQVCVSYESAAPARRSTWRQCVTSALERGVATVDNAALSSLHRHAVGRRSTTSERPPLA